MGYIDNYLQLNSTSAQQRALYFDRLDGLHRSFGIGRFVNMFIMEGRKETVENAFLKVVIQLKKFFSGKLNYQGTFTYLVNGTKPWFEMRKFIKRGELQDYPKLMLKGRGYAKAVRQMALTGKKSFEYALGKRIFDSAISMFLNKSGSGLNEGRRDLLWSVVDVRYKLKSTRYNKAMGVRFFKSLKTHSKRSVRMHRAISFLQYFKERIFDKVLWTGQFKKHLDSVKTVDAMQFRPAVKGKHGALNPQGAKLLKRGMIVSNKVKVMFQNYKTKMISKDFKDWRVLRNRLNKYYGTGVLKQKEVKNRQYGSRFKVVSATPAILARYSRIPRHNPRYNKLSSKAVSTKMVNVQLYNKQHKHSVIQKFKNIK